MTQAQIKHSAGRTPQQPATGQTAKPKPKPRPTRKRMPKAGLIGRAVEPPADDGTVSTTVRILNKEYQISCQESEQEALLKSARYLDRNMGKIKRRDRIQDIETVAVIAALNITNELLRKNRLADQSKQTGSRQLRELEKKVDAALRRARESGV